MTNTASKGGHHTTDNYNGSTRAVLLLKSQWQRRLGPTKATTGSRNKQHFIKRQYLQRQVEQLAITGLIPAWGRHRRKQNSLCNNMDGSGEDRWHGGSSLKAKIRPSSLIIIIIIMMTIASRHLIDFPQRRAKRHVREHNVSSTYILTYTPEPLLS